MKIHPVLRYATILLCGILLAVALLSAVYLLPEERMLRHLGGSVNQLKLEDSYPKFAARYQAARLDNYTDALMLNIAVYECDAPLLERVLGSYYAHYHQPPIGDLLTYYTGEPIVEQESYARYWHGYLVVLKPLLQLFDYMDIRMFNLICLYTLMAVVLYAMVKKLGVKYAAAFWVMLLFLSPAAISMCMQYSTVTYLSLFGVLAMLLFDKKLTTPSSYTALFLVFGMATSYFDLLTFPVLVPGVMLTVFVLQHTDMPTGQKCGRIATLFFAWLVGYGVLWLAKFPLAALVLPESPVPAAQEAVTGWLTPLDDEGQVLTFFAVVDAVVYVVSFSVYRYGALFLLALFAVGYIRHHRPVRTLSETLLPLLLVAVLPFLWYFVMRRPTYVHPWFKYRAMGVTVFALCSILASTLRVGGPREALPPLKNSID